jgi:hypothetical protein
LHQSQKNQKRQKEDEMVEMDETRQKMMNSTSNTVQQTLPDELFLGLFGTGAGRVRAAVLPKGDSH